MKNLIKLFSFDHNIPSFCKMRIGDKIFDYVVENAICEHNTGCVDWDLILNENGIFVEFTQDNDLIDYIGRIEIRVRPAYVVDLSDIKGLFQKLASKFSYSSCEEKYQNTYDTEDECWYGQFDCALLDDYYKINMEGDTDSFLITIEKVLDDIKPYLKFNHMTDYTQVVSKLIQNHAK